MVSSLPRKILFISISIKISLKKMAIPANRPNKNSNERITERRDPKLIDSLV
jgi:hypothetical protein